MDIYEAGLSEHERGERRMVRRAQPFLREAATAAGHFAGCALSKCRRAKQCLGRHPDAEIGSSHYKNFPPCVTDTKSQDALIHAGQKIEDDRHRAMLARGYSPEQLQQLYAKNEAAIRESDNWPEDPLADVRQEPGVRQGLGRRPASRKAR